MAFASRRELLTIRPAVWCLLAALAASSCATPAHRQYKAPRRQLAAARSAGYAIQAGAFSQVKNAEALAGRLQQKGIDAFYFRKSDGIFVVRFGDYRDQEEARKAAARLVADGVLETYYVAPPVDAASYAPRPVRKPADSRKKRRDDLGAVIARTAERFIGIPYRWGGNTVVDGMDCSGFTRAVYNLCGITIPRTAQEQFNAGDRIDRDEMDEGDLVFFGESSGRITHVGVYVGDGTIVHAPKRGDDIKTAKITDSWFSSRFAGARRYF